MTKKTRSAERDILKALNRGEIMTDMIALEDYHTRSLRRIIADLREQGKDIITAMVPVKVNHYRRTVTIGTYFLRRHKSKSLQFIANWLGKEKIKRSSVTIFEWAKWSVKKRCFQGDFHADSNLVSSTWRLPDVK